MIEIRGVSKTFETDRGFHVALRDVDLSIAAGDIYGIIGLSGAGKSTLVRCINMLERPDSGSILIDGVDVTELAESELRLLRSNVSMIFQNFNLFQQKTVLENVLFPFKVTNNLTPDNERRAHDLLARVGLDDKAHIYPSRLSGGQQQRVAIARALANRPSVILCDEATSALDTLTTNSILKLLRDLSRDLGVTLVVITHSMDVVEKICNKVAVLDGGVVLEKGRTKDVFANPQFEVTKRLLGRVVWDA